MSQQTQSYGFFFMVHKWRGSTSVQRMSFAERGVYLEMLFEQWEKKSLPDDVQAVANLIAVTPQQIAEVEAAWETVRRKFSVVTNGHKKDACQICNLALERTRREQAAYRRRMSDNGRKGGVASVLKRHELGVKPGQAPLKPSLSPVKRIEKKRIEEEEEEKRTDLKRTEVKSSADQPPTLTHAPQTRHGQPRRPLFQNHRFVVHRWQQEELISMLGVHADGFDLDEWLMTGAVQRADAETGIVPDWWKWLKAETLAEAQRRGLPIASPTIDIAGKQTTRLASTLANIRRQEGA